ncbi:hypothetical protein AWE51_17390 [Aquimarina aggregata]|uniref:YCII-related domain-containing protein n=1 Tax=Aquimarina aggregata TaxID=1642818 RepID=A0A162WYD2_9FLAO|nr:YciI family protein [Aquimarina aggregata]KZS38331.1 hypothetical protein AWE51_17390 [Aquimarina aggregata]
MRDFLFIIRGGQDRYNQNSPEEMQQHMQDWQQWMDTLAQKDMLVGGQPLMNEAKTLIDGGQKIIDRPLAEGKELIGGYLLIKANSLEHAAGVAKECPSNEYHCSIEVREISPM